MGLALSQSLAEGSYFQNLFTTRRSGASESSLDIRDMIVIHLTVHWHNHNLKTETLACQSAVRFLEAQVAQNLELRRTIEVGRQTWNTIAEEIITVLTRYRPIVLELI